MLTWWPQNQKVKDLKQSINVFLNTLNLEEIPKLRQSIEVSKIQGASLCIPIFEKMEQLICFKHLVKSLTEDQEQNKNSQIRKQYLEKLGNAKQIFQNIQQRIGKLDKFQKIYKKVTQITPLLKEIAKKQIEQERQISMIIHNEQDEIEQYQRLYEVLKQLYECHQDISEKWRNEQASIDKTKQDNKNLVSQVQNFKNHIIRKIEDNFPKFQKKIQRPILESNFDHSVVIDIQDQNMSKGIEPKPIFRHQGIQSIDDSINKLFKLLELCFEKQEKLTKDLREQREKEDVELKSNLKKSRQSQNQKLKQELKKSRESDHIKIKEDLRKQRELENQKKAKELEENRLNEDKMLRFELQNQRIKEINQRMQQFEKNERGRLQIQIRDKLQQELIKHNLHRQLEQQTRFKKLEQQIKIEEEKLSINLKQRRQKEQKNISEEISHIRKKQQTNLQIQKQKYIAKLQRQKQQSQKLVQEQLKDYRSKQDLRIQEKLRIARQLKDQEQKKRLQKNRKQQDIKMRNDLEQARLQEDKRLRQKLKISRQALNYDCSKFFAHNILRKKIQYKQFLVSTISQRHQVDIQDTELIFTFDPKNNTNFHQYIDNKRFLLVLIELQNGRILAAYTQQAFRPKVKGSDSFITCLNTKAIYDYKNGDKSSISYDEYYIIFGNSEIRIKSGEKLLFSNFGIGNSFFDHKGHSLDQLLGYGKTNQVPLNSYQIYQLKFE